MLKNIKRIKNKLKAFSLIEMLLVIAIMGVLFGILNSTEMNVWYADGTFYYIKQTYWNSFNINNYKYQGNFPDYGEMKIFPWKNITFYVYYRDSSEASGYKEVEWNHDQTIIDTVWLNGKKIDSWEGIIFKVSFLTDNFADRFKIEKEDSNKKITDITNTYNKLCFENFSSRRYCINKAFHVYQIKIRGL